MKNKWLAAALNVLPGLGYLYLGVRRAFAVILLCYLPAIVLASLTDPSVAAASDTGTSTSPWLLLAFFGLPMVAFMVDAYQEAGRVNQEAGKRGAKIAAHTQAAATTPHAAHTPAHAPQEHRPTHTPADATAELDHFVQWPAVINRRLSKRGFIRLVFGLGLAVCVLTFAAMVAAYTDTTFVDSLELPANADSVGLLLGNVALGLFVIYGFYAAVCWGIAALLNRRTFVHTIGLLDFLPNSQNRLSTYVKWALLIAELWIVAYWLKSYQYVNPVVLMLEAAKYVASMATLWALTAALSGALTKPAKTPTAQAS